MRKCRSNLETPWLINYNDYFLQMPVICTPLLNTQHIVLSNPQSIDLPSREAVYGVVGRRRRRCIETCLPPPLIIM